MDANDTDTGVERSERVAPESLAPERYKVQFTATAEYVRLVEEAKALLSHAAPRAALAPRRIASRLTPDAISAFDAPPIARLAALARRLPLRVIPGVVIQ